MPETLQSWSGFILAILSSAVIVLGVVVRLARHHINTRISIVLSEVVSDAVRAEVETLRTQINNGLTHRQERIENKMDRLIDHFIPWDGKEERRGNT